MKTTTSDTAAIDWRERKARAMAHTRTLVAEWGRARGKKTMPKWVVYDYREEADDGNNHA